MSTVGTAAALGDASDTMMAHPLALQLRNLQSLVEIGVDKNTNPQVHRATGSGSWASTRTASATAPARPQELLRDPGAPHIRADRQSEQREHREQDLGPFPATRPGAMVE